MARQHGRIDLIRHAQDDSTLSTPSFHPWPGSPLTQRGIENARAAATAIRADYAGIVYSPIHRAKQTAALLATGSGLPLLTDVPSLSEWRPPSCVYGKTPDEYDDAYRAWRHDRAADPSLAYQDGESLLALHERAASAIAELEELAAEHGPLLAVSHRVLLGVLTNLELGPTTAFERATSDPWPHCEVRKLAAHSRTEA